MSEAEKSRFEKELENYLRFGSKLGLERMETLLHKLGDPHLGLKVIHVAGTNGKGSVCKYLSEALLAAGYTAGLYISPYITCFRERIQLNGHFIPEEELDRYGGQVLAAAAAMEEEGLEPPTEFELVTAVAFLYYAAEKPDFVVLEVGLGGRGDSTNVIPDPLACVITSITFDHMDRLGDTLAKIAYEKAGILKPGAPLIMNVEAGEAKAEIRRIADEKGAEVLDVADTVFSDVRLTPEGMVFDLTYPEALPIRKQWDGVRLSMTGKHQCLNAATAIATLEKLRLDGIIEIDQKTMYEGLFRAVQPCRMERMALRKNGKSGPLFLLDGCHNEAAWDFFVESIAVMYPDRKFWLITGILGDKAVDQAVERIVKLGAEKILAVDVPNPRNLPAEIFAGKFPEGTDVEAAGDPKAAMERARAALEAGEIDLCLAAGSLYLVSEIRRTLLEWQEEETES